MELRSFFFRHVRQRRVLAQLEGADVRDDRPAVAHRNPVFIGIHPANAAGDHIEIVADRSAAQSFGVERRRTREPAAHDHAVPRTHAVMTNGAVDVVALMAAFEHRPRHGIREDRRLFAMVHAGVKQRIRLQMTPRHGSFDWKPRPTAVVEETARSERPYFRLILHAVLKAVFGASGEHDGSRQEKRPKVPRHTRPWIPVLPEKSASRLSGTSDRALRYK